MDNLSNKCYILGRRHSKTTSSRVWIIQMGVYCKGNELKVQNKFQNRQTMPSKIRQLYAV